MNLPVILCIGAVSVTGDRLGPMVGDLLRNRYCVPAFVYGGRFRPVNGINFPEYVSHIKRIHPGSLVIAVDASVGAKEDVGKIKYSLNGVRAGGALNKKLGKVGDIGVMGVVAPRAKDNLKALMDAPFSLVEELADEIAMKLSAFINGLSASSEKFHPIDTKLSV